MYIYNTGNWLTVLEIEKSRSRKASGSKSEGRMSQMEDRQRARIVSHSAFCAFQTFSDWVRPTHSGEGNLLAQLIKMLILLRNALTDPPRIMFGQISGHSVTQSN